MSPSSKSKSSKSADFFHGLFSSMVFFLLLFSDLYKTIIDTEEPSNIMVAE